MGKWDLMAGVDMGVALGLHMAWAMVLRMASATMVLALMVSLKDMANSPLPMASSLLSMDNSLPSMANSLLHLLIRQRLMGKHSSSNLQDISRLHSQLTPSKLPTPNSKLISHQLMPSSLPILQHLHRSAL